MAWVRVLAVGGGWGLLMMALMGSIERLEGQAPDWVFFGIWTLAALAFGVAVGRAAPQAR